MVLEGLFTASGAWSAYSYNLSRYQWDSHQAQKATLMKLESRIQLWNLFREDVKEMSNLFSVNMKEYILFGTLFVGYGFAFLRSSFAGFPLQPPWMLMMFLNCIISGLAFGVLGIWFAVHGTIKSEASRVQMLTQQVRPPIPTDADYEALRLNVGMFEAMGPRHYFQPPDVMGLRTRASELASELMKEEEPTQPVQPNRSPRAAPDHAAGLTQLEPQNIFNTLTMPEHRQQYSPGPASTVFGHVPVFQAQMREYASFFAYAQVSLTLCVNQTLCGFMYYLVMQVNQLWKSVDRDGRFTSEDFIFCTIMFSCVWIFMVINVALMRLDLSAPKVIMRPMQMILLLKPLPMVLAVFMDPFHGWFQSSNGLQSIRSLLVAGSCMFHLFWLQFMETSARPTDLGNGLQLPMQFRAVKNFHVSGVTAPNKQRMLTVGSVEPNLRSSGNAFQIVKTEQATGSFSSSTLLTTARQRIPEPAEALAQPRENVPEPRQVPESPSLSEESQEKIPCRYFRQMTRAIMLPWLLAWGACLGYSADLMVNSEHFPQLDNITLANQQPGRLEATRVSQVLAKGTPVSLACAGSILVLASSFEIFVGELPTAFSDDVPYASLTSTLTARNLTAPWTSLAVLQSASEPRVLLLEEAGAAVWEHALLSKGEVPRQWPVGSTLEALLIQISVVFGPAVVEECGSSEHDWLVTAVTDKQQLVVLCPQDGVLQPVRVLGDVLHSTIQAHQLRAGELMQLGMDTTGGLLQRSGPGSSPQRWILPHGKWVPGFCLLHDGAVIMASQSSETGVEVWRISSDGPDPDLPVSVAFLSPGKEIL